MTIKYYFEHISLLFGIHTSPSPLVSDTLNLVGWLLVYVILFHVIITATALYCKHMNQGLRLKAINEQECFL